jgi:hypothetical protein
MTQHIQSRSRRINRVPLYLLTFRRKVVPFAFTDSNKRRVQLPTFRRKVVPFTFTDSSKRRVQLPTFRRKVVPSPSRTAAKEEYSYQRLDGRWCLHLHGQQRRVQLPTFRRKVVSSPSRTAVTHISRIAVPSPSVSKQAKTCTVSGASKDRGVYIFKVKKSSWTPWLLSLKPISADTALTSHRFETFSNTTLRISESWLICT